MAERAAIVTGGSSGIGLAIAELLAEAGYGITLAARRPDPLVAAATALRERGFAVAQVAGDLADEAAVAQVVRTHEDRFGRLDVLVNSAGIGAGEPVDALTTRKVDLQLDLNLRSMILMHREAVPLLRRAGAEHRRALIINLASISGIQGEGWLSVYSATKHGVVGFTQAMNKELAGSGIRSTALCPGFVDTPMTHFLEGHIAKEDMIQLSDIVAAVRFLLATTPGCQIPEIRFEPPGGVLVPDVEA